MADGITYEATDRGVHCCRAPPSAAVPLVVIVESMGGDEYSISVESATIRVGKLKVKLSERNGMAVEQQTLLRVAGIGGNQSKISTEQLADSVVIDSSCRLLLSLRTARELFEEAATGPPFQRHDGAQIKKLMQLAAQQGDRTAMAYDLLRGGSKDRQKAFVMFEEEFVETGYTHAQYGMALCHMMEKGEEKKDEATTLDLLKQAANAGHAKACCVLAKACELGRLANGFSITKDETQAVDWYRKAAEAGNADAQYELGCRYVQGRGVAQDKARAKEWLVRAAELGNKWAPEELQHHDL